MHLAWMKSVQRAPESGGSCLCVLMPGWLCIHLLIRNIWCKCARQCNMPHLTSYHSMGASLHPSHVCRYNQSDSCRPDRQQDQNKDGVMLRRTIPTLILLEWPQHRDYWSFTAKSTTPDCCWQEATGFKGSSAWNLFMWRSFYLASLCRSATPSRVDWDEMIWGDQRLRWTIQIHKRPHLFFYEYLTQQFQAPPKVAVLYSKQKAPFSRKLGYKCSLMSTVSLLSVW